MEGLKMMVYGVAGIGKTTFLGSGAEDERLWPALLLDLEAGTLPLTDRLVNITPDWGQESSLDAVAESLNQLEKGKIACIRIKEVADLQDVLIILKTRKPVLRSLIVDSLTELNYLNLGTVVREAAAKNFKQDPDTPTIADYGRSAVQMRRLFREFRDLPCHVLFSALAQENKDELTGSLEWRPSLTGKLAEECPAMVDVLGYYTQVPEVGRRMYFQPIGRFRAKDRSPMDPATGRSALGDYVDNPTLPKLLDLLGVGVTEIPKGGRPKKSVEPSTINDPQS